MGREIQSANPIPGNPRPRASSNKVPSKSTAFHLGQVSSWNPSRISISFYLFRFVELTSECISKLLVACIIIPFRCQRRQFKLFLSGKKSYMTMDRIRKLSSVGFVFNPRKLAGSMELTLAELQEMEAMVERQRQGAAQGQQSNQDSSFPMKDQEETNFHEA